VLVLVLVLVLWCCGDVNDDDAGGDEDEDDDEKTMATSFMDDRKSMMVDCHDQSWKCYIYMRLSYPTKNKDLPGHALYRMHYCPLSPLTPKVKPL
jgi:hypothetical protein